MTFELSASDRAIADRINAEHYAVIQGVLRELRPALAFTADPAEWVIDDYDIRYAGDECDYPSWIVANDGLTMTLEMGTIEFQSETFIKRGGGYDYERTARALLRAVDGFNRPTTEEK